MSEHTNRGAYHIGGASIIGLTPARSTAYRWARQARQGGAVGVTVTRSADGYYTVSRPLTAREAARP